MTDTADTSDGLPGDGEPRRRSRKSRLLRWAALGASVAVAAAAVLGWSVYQKLDGNIRTDPDTTRELEQYAAERPEAVVHGALDILVIGSDNRGDGNGEYGRDSGSQRSDTTMLLHLAADRRSATAVSIPRDLMVDIPACDKPDGTRTAAQFAQFNWAFEFAGAACTIRTVEQLTGIRVDHHMIVDFNGFKRMVDAVGGVEVCLAEPVNDLRAQLRLPAGRQLLGGEEALGYVRARYSLGDGTDTERMARQQQFLAAMVKKVQSSGVLFNPARLYPLLDAATASLTTDPGLASLKDLYDPARGMREIPASGMRFLTVPRQPYRFDANRDELVQPDASVLFQALIDDERVAVSEEAGTAAQEDTRAEGPSSYLGTTAEDSMCE